MIDIFNCLFFQKIFFSELLFAYVIFVDVVTLISITDLPSFIKSRVKKS